MGQLGKYVRWESLEGTPVHRNGTSVTPISQVIGVQTRYGGFQWNRPIAVRVETPAGESRLPIVDVTRVAQAALLALSALLFILSRRGDTASVN